MYNAGLTLIFFLLNELSKYTSAVYNSTLLCIFILLYFLLDDMHVEMCFVYVHLFTPRKILSAAIYLIPGESLKVETSGKLEGGNQFV